MSDGLADLIRELELMGAGASITIEIRQLSDGTAWQPPQPKLGAIATVHSPNGQRDWEISSTAVHVLHLSLLENVRTIRVRDSLIAAGWTPPTP